MRFLLRSLAPALVLVLLSACSTAPELQLTVTPAQIAGDGVSPVTIKVKLTLGGAPTAGTVHITASAGRIKDVQGGDTSTYDATVSDGAATITILPPRKGRGTIDIVATASLEGTALKKTAQVTLVPAGGLANTISFTCDRQNIGAFVTGRSEPLHVLCTAVARDASSKIIPNASIETMAEAGRLEWITNDTTGAQNLIYTVDPGATPPKDVDPFDSTGKPTATCSAACQTGPDTSGCIEPCWNDAGKVRNPRDGLATLIVAVPGVKAFDDLGEPFVDSDDDGLRSAGEAYIDYNGNGKYDGPDGTQKERMLWAKVGIVWSGEADVSPTVHGSKFTSTVNGLTAQMKVRLNDRNFNTLAADGTAGADEMTISAGTCDQGHALTLPSAGIKLVQDTPGIKLLTDVKAGGIDGHFPSSYRVGSDYTFNASIDAKPDRCDLSAQISRTYDPGAPNFSSAGQLSTEVVTGSVAF